MADAYLILADGRAFPAERRGAPREAIGELVFTTSMGDANAVLTDPGHYGEIVVGTFPIAGSCGAIGADREGEKTWLSGYVVHALSEIPSNFRSEGALEDWLRAEGVPVLTGLDTRALTRIIREEGVLNAMISDTATLSEEAQERLRSYAIRGAVAAVTAAETSYAGAGKRVLLWDFGAKASLAQGLIERGAEVVRVPAFTPAAELLALEPMGVVLAGGPGDPAENPQLLPQIRFLIDSGLPILGVGLGHQLLALARGGRVRRMKYGHRGANQPARDLKTGRVSITSQNHGYCVVGESLTRSAAVRYVNANDGTCEGIDYAAFPGFSIQFDPDAAVLDRFFALLEGREADA